jgi:Protein of unknown function (DUF1553)/Protein of unknown function (DUF1549)/Concanavalin A-like lectin/glucanases superfamily
MHSSWQTLTKVCVFAIAFSVSRTTFSAEPKTPNEADVVLKLDFESQVDANTAVGDVEIRSNGPSNDLFDGLPAKNNALNLKTAGAHLRIADSQDSGPLDFTDGDAITLEAWVKLDHIANDANLYVIGKGRTYEHGVSENQNYALRLRGVNREARASFLFATNQSESKPNFHRWTSSKGFAADSIWHHIAISYRFGDPTSIQAVVDGETSKGSWDMAGATNLPPISDNDSVWIGSSRGGDPGNSLVGSIDDVRVYRKIIDAKTLMARRKVIPQIPHWPATAQEDVVTVTLHPGAGSHTSFPLVANEAFRFTLPKMALHRLPLRYDAGGVRKLWIGPVHLRAFAKVAFPVGKVELLVRSPGLTRLWVDGDMVLTTPARRLSPDAHQPFIKYQSDLEWLREPRIGDNEVRKHVQITKPVTELILESQVGSNVTRCELGETLVAFRIDDKMFTLAGPGDEPIQLVDHEVESYCAQVEQKLAAIDRHLLFETSGHDDDFWRSRHQLAREYLETLPPIAITSNKELRAKESIDLLISEGLDAAALARGRAMGLFDTISDVDFLRRASLDCIGVPPTLIEVQDFENDPSEGKRERAVDRLIADDRWADHWTSYWQDVLAENPNILKPSLNNSGPFRMWIHDALLTNKPIDRFVTELIRMDGDSHAGAAAGFAIAAENDVPMAEKAHIIAGAFLGLDMKCARCHDAPYHPWKQADLFQLGALLAGKTIEVPPTSSVPQEFFERKGRDSPIKVTLHPGDKIEPKWPFTDFGDVDLDPRLMAVNQSTREQVAALITRPQNERFAQVIANRVWTRLMGWGPMATVDDWDGEKPRNARLLNYLAHQLLAVNYDLKQFVKLILTSDVYQRKAIEGAKADTAIAFAAPWHRRLTAEQLVDSAHTVAGIAMETEPVTFDPEGSQHLVNFLNLGPAKKAWQLTSLSNERDRPSLALPKAAAVCECLEALGWQASRQAPVTHRETEPNMVQPGVIANGSLTGWVTRLTDNSALTQLAIDAKSPEQFVEQLFLQVLSRRPSPAEQSAFIGELAPGFDDRIQQLQPTQRAPKPHRGFATWTNHFSLEANDLMIAIGREVAAGPTPTERLKSDWRMRAEDAAWVLLNTPEFQFVP